MTRLFAVALAALAASAGAASAHHSFAMYDQNKVMPLNGTVKSFAWTSPHAQLWVLSPPADGRPADLWSVELSTSPGNLTRMGWSKQSLKPGDRVVVEINPLRDGQRGGALKKVTLVATGEVLTTTPPTDKVATR